ncbi:MAG: hypothetical protein ACYCZO_10775 [Daejeonella sp.]
MKTNILKISILPLIILTMLEFATLQPQKENNKGNKGNNSQGDGKGHNQKNNNDSRRNNDNSQRNNDRYKNNQREDRNDQNRDRENKNERSDREDKDHGPENSGKNYDKMNGNDDKGKFKDQGRGKETIRWDRDESINWGLNDFKSRKRPKDFKKVTVCHSTGGDSFPVSINISENALQAHLNHGDQTGNCTTNYSERWPQNYIRTRENVYNTYENTWETMSYSEALVRYAADKLLGIKSNLQRDRSTLTAQEIQRREAVILDLQTNVTGLESQIGVTRQRLDGVNINIIL